MNFVKVLIVTCILLTAACDFEFPLSTDNSTHINRAILGVWQILDAEENEEGEVDESATVTILPFSETEYLIKYGGDDATYFSAFPINIAGHEMLQLKLIGNYRGPPENTETKLYLVISYTIEDDELIYRALSERLAGKDINSTSALRQAFAEQKDDPWLFSEAAKLTRVTSNAIKKPN